MTEIVNGHAADQNCNGMSKQCRQCALIGLIAGCEKALHEPERIIADITHRELKKLVNCG
jgi:hypothetical protein